MNEKDKLLLAVILTAGLVISGTYLFTQNKNIKESGATILEDDETNIEESNLTSKEYAVASRKTWSAFECSSLALITEDTQEAHRLLSYGYDQGRLFLDAYERGLIESGDLSQEMPFIMSFYLGGPSIDFILGRMYEGAQENATSEIYEKSQYEDVRMLEAENLFRKQNCNILGS